MVRLTMRKPKILALKVIVTFVPVYLVAFLSNDMVFVLPTLAVALLIGVDAPEPSDEGESNDG